MMKKILSILILALLSSHVFAQDILEYETRTFSPYWYTGINVGSNLYMAEGNDFLSGNDGVRFSLRDNSGTTIRATFGRRFTPVIGVRGYAGYSSYKWLSAYHLNPVVTFGSEFITADLTISLINMLEENYSLKRYDLGLFLGTGLQLRNEITSPAVAASNSSLTPVGRLGLEASFLLTNYLGLSFGGEFNFVNDNNNGMVAGRNYEFIPAFSVGLNYQLKAGKK